MRLSIIIVNYNTEKMIKRCLQSIENFLGNMDVEIIVVDNNSADNSIDMIKNRFPTVKLIENKNNVGFAAANNIGIKQSEGEYLLILNPDTEMIDESINGMQSYLEEHSEIGAIGPKLLNSDLSLQDSCRKFYDIRTILFRRTFLGKIFPNNKYSKAHVMKNIDRDVIQEIDWMLAACLLIKRTLIEDIGLFDEKYRLYFEDVDLCYRIKLRGYKVVYYPKTQLVHHYRRSSAIRFSKVTVWHIMSGIRFFRKFGWRF